ncbi:MAG: aminoglycoside phosphotransferase family protein, partial [Pararhizobium sp.]
MPATLRIVVEPEERLGGLPMQYWDGQGAARVHAYEDDATLLERAEGKRSLLTLAMNEADDDASRIICKTVRILHEPRDKPYT